MSTLHGIGLLLLAVIAGAVVPFQSAINANLGRGLGHPLWATLASLLVSILVLLPIMLAMRVPLPSVAFISKAPLWMWAGGAFGVCFISLALVLLPKLPELNKRVQRLEKELAGMKELLARFQSASPRTDEETS